MATNPAGPIRAYIRRVHPTRDARKIATKLEEVERILQESRAVSFAADALCLEIGKRLPQPPAEEPSKPKQVNLEELVEPIETAKPEAEVVGRFSPNEFAIIVIRHICDTAFGETDMVQILTKDFCGENRLDCNWSSLMRATACELKSRLPSCHFEAMEIRNYKSWFSFRIR